jgi:hypothetical protein
MQAQVLYVEDLETCPAGRANNLAQVRQLDAGENFSPQKQPLRAGPHIFRVMP